MWKRVFLAFALVIYPINLARACGGGADSLSTVSDGIFELDAARVTSEHLGGANSISSVGLSNLFGILYSVADFFSRKENIQPLTAVRTNLEVSEAARNDPSISATGKDYATRADYSLQEIDRAFAGIK